MARRSRAIFPNRAHGACGLSLSKQGASKRTLQTSQLGSSQLAVSIGLVYGDLDHFFVAVNVPFTMPPMSNLPFMVFFSTVPSYVTGAC